MLHYILNYINIIPLTIIIKIIIKLNYKQIIDLYYYFKAFTRIIQTKIKMLEVNKLNRTCYVLCNTILIFYEVFNINNIIFISLLFFSLFKTILDCKRKWISWCSIKEKNLITCQVKVSFE